MRSAILVSLMMMIGCGGGGAAKPLPEPVKPAPPPAVRAEPSPEREDFENATVGSAPAGWSPGSDARDLTYTAERRDTGIVLQVVTTGDAGGGSIKHPLDVARYRGRRIEIDARGSCEPRRRFAYAVVGVDVSRAGLRGYG